MILNPIKPGEMVHLTGIERYSESDVLGELVCPEISIWNKVSRSKEPVAIGEHEDVMDHVPQWEAGAVEGKLHV